MSLGYNESAYQATFVNDGDSRKNILFEKIIQ